MSNRHGLIKAALQKLPIRPESKHQLGFWVDFVEVTVSPSPPVVASISHGSLTPHEYQQQVVHPEKAARQLQDIANLLRDLLVALEGFSPTADEALDAYALDADVVRNLKKIKLLSATCEPYIRHAAKMEAEVARRFPKKTGGRHRDYASLEVAEAVGFAFHDLTGTLPTVTTTVDGRASGPFLALVAAVFSAAEIKASPETFARKAVKSVPPKIRENPFDSFKRDPS